MGGLLGCLCLCRHTGCHLCEFLGSSLATVQYNILYERKQVGGNVTIGDFSGRVYDAEVHAVGCGMIEEYGMHGLAYVVVATEGEREIAHASADMGTWQVLPNPTCGPYEVDGVGIVLLHASGNGKYIGVEDNVERVHANLVSENVVGALGYGYAPVEGSGLPLLVEAHHHNGSTMAHDIAGM